MITYNEFKQDKTEMLNAYLEAGLLRPESRYPALVGAGGKSSTLYALGKAFACLEKRVCLTTSTHMARPKAPLIEDEAVLQAGRPAGSINVLGLPAAHGKIKAVPFMEHLPLYFDIVLVEADGSRRLPLKVPAAREPVIPEFCDQILIVAGLKALDRPFSEVCHRLPNTLAITGKKEDEPVTEADIALLLKKGYIEALSGSRPAGVILNQADSPELLRRARLIAEKLAPCPVIIQRLRGETV